MGTKHGKYSTDDLGRDGSGPIKVTEMDKKRTKNFTVDDGVSFADVVDRNSARKTPTGGWRLRSNASGKPLQMKTMPSLEERINSASRGNTTVIAAYVDERAAHGARRASG